MATGANALVRSPRRWNSTTTRRRSTSPTTPDFGLSGAVHTRDISRGVRITRRIHTGMIHVNDATHGDEPVVASGGQKRSGIGRLNGQSSIDELTALEWVSVNPGRRNYPYQ